MAELTGSLIFAKYKHEIAHGISDYIKATKQQHLATQGVAYSILLQISDGHLAKDGLQLDDLIAYGKITLRHEQKPSEADLNDIKRLKRIIHTNFIEKAISSRAAISRGITYIHHLSHNHAISEQAKTLSIGLKFAAALSVIGITPDNFDAESSVFTIPVTLLQPFGQLKTTGTVNLALNNSEANMNFLMFNNPLKPDQPIILYPNIVALTKFLTHKKIKETITFNYHQVINTLIKMMHTDNALPDDPALTEAIKALTILCVERLKHRKE